MESLLKWKNSTYRRPLILRGARQTGKTWLLKEFGRIAFNKMVYVNFEETPALQNLFLTDFDITRIVTTISIFTNTSIDAKDTLLVFDEIQSAEKGLTSLKYFCENAPEYYFLTCPLEN